MNLGKTGDVNMGHFCPTSARGVECNYCGHCHIYDPTVDERIETYAQPQPGERAQTANQDQLPRGVIQGNQSPAAYEDHGNYADDADYDDDVDFGYYDDDAHNGYHDDDAVYDSHPEDHPPADHYYEDRHRVNIHTSQSGHYDRPDEYHYDGRYRVNIHSSQSGHYDRPDEYHYDGRYRAIIHTIQPARQNPPVDRYDEGRHGVNIHTSQPALHNPPGDRYDEGRHVVNSYGRPTQGIRSANSGSADRCSNCSGRIHSRHGCRCSKTQDKATKKQQRLVKRLGWFAT